MYNLHTCVDVYVDSLLPPRPPRPRITGMGGKADYLCDPNRWVPPLRKPWWRQKPAVYSWWKERGGTTWRRSWVGRLGRVRRLATLSIVKLLLCAHSLWQTHLSGRELGRVALPTVQSSTNCPGRVSLNTASARMEEFIWYLWWTPHGRGTGQVAGLSGRKGAGPE